MRRNRSPKWKPMVIFFLVWLGGSVGTLSAQSPAEDQVWDQLRSACTTARNDGYFCFNYMVGFLNKDTWDSNWARRLVAGASYLIVGVCDNDCADVNLFLQDDNEDVIASDTAINDTPVIRYTASSAARYWIVPRMNDCRVQRCAYGIGFFVKVE